MNLWKQPSVSQLPYTVPGCPYCMPIEMRKEAYKDDATD